MMRSLRHIGVILAVVVMVVMGYGVQPGLAGSSTAIRVQEKVLEDYSGQSMPGAEFFNEDLEGTNFKGAYMDAAVFKGTNLRQSNLSEADLSHSFFFQSHLDNADLTNAILEEAFLMQTSFNGAKITGADFSYAVITPEHLKVLCDLAEGTNPVTGVDTKESLECR